MGTKRSSFIAPISRKSVAIGVCSGVDYIALNYCFHHSFLILSSFTEHVKEGRGLQYFCRSMLLVTGGM